jgi:DNA-binding MarR family transcriptional regulator
LSHAVSRLEQCGWVRREGIETDRRGQVAIITEQGRQKLTDTAPGHVETVRQAVFDALSPEQIAQLHDICGTLVRHSGGTYDDDRWEGR